MNKRQKAIATNRHPLCREKDFASREEVKSVKLLARRHQWHESDSNQFVAYSPSGRRRFFRYHPYDNELAKKLAQKAARLWAKGQYKRAKEVEHYANYEVED